MVPYPTIPPLHVGPLTLHAFGALVATGFIVGAYLAARRARAVGLDPQPISDVSVLCMVVGITGAHVATMVFYRTDELLRDPLEIFKIWSGLSSYGGFVAAGIAVYIYFKRKKLRFLPYADALMFGLVPGWFFGRIGCYTAHDHPGRLTDFFLAVNYPGGARHDLGFYEILLSVVIFAILHVLGRKKEMDRPPAGTMYAVTLILYGIPRFFLDYLRATDLSNSDTRYLGLTFAQYASVAVVGLGAYLLYKIRPPKNESVT